MSQRLRGALMVCGTASNSGKSVLVAGLCRLLARRGVSVAPFKGQNMSLNSVVTADGAEIGRAQGAQAAAAGVPPEAAMNPVLLKPMGERRSQVVVMGRPWQVLDASGFQRVKPQLRGTVLDALADLRRRHDVVVLEGAGSPAEINLLEGDLVNLGLAERARVPAVVVGDIDRGGVFAHLFGTIELLPADLRRCVRGFIINKLRGDPALLGQAPAQLEARTGVPTIGVIPWIDGVSIDAEDSLALLSDFARSGVGSGPGVEEVLDVAVLRFPRLSNFTDLDALCAEPGVCLRWVEHPAQLGDPDLVILPGTKSTVADLAWMRERGLAEALRRLLARDRSPSVLGICGGYQMLGWRIVDTEGVEAPVGTYEALGLLDVETSFVPEKRTARRDGHERGTELAVAGYEIHHGLVTRGECAPWFTLDGVAGPEEEGAVSNDGAVHGTSLHGLLESDQFRGTVLSEAAQRRAKRWSPSDICFATLRAAQVDRVADACEQHLDLDTLFRIVGEARR